MNKKLIKVSNALSLTEFKHIFKVMKLTSLFGVLCVSSAFAVNVNSQSLRVNIHANQKQAKEVIKQIEEQTDYLFVYNHDKVNLNNTVTIQANNETVAEVLNQMFAGTDIIYAMQGNNILLMQKDAVVQQSGKVVTGTIVDPSGMPVIGANVKVKGTTNGTITDMNGHFSLEVEEGAVLQISYIGYANQEIEVGNQNKLSIALKEDAEALDELVVVGYGMMKKSDLTGSLSSVNSEDLTAFAVSNPIQALQGRAAGVNITTNSGSPEGSFTVRIRGANSIRANNDPLYIVDGFPANVSSVNPDDIESVEVLKDASASAIYGSRGSNGVVLITTKSGRKGRTQVSYDGSYGFQSHINKLDMMDATDYMLFYNEQQLNDKGAAYFTSDQIAAAGKGTNWQDLTYRTAPLQTHSLSISGGNDKTDFYIGSYIFLRDGIIQNSGYKKYQARTNINHKISDYFNVGARLAYTRTTTDRQSSSGGNRGGSLIGASISAPPTLTPYNDDGSYQNLQLAYPFMSNALYNPLNIINETSNQTKADLVNFNGFLEWKPVKGLSLKTSVGLEALNYIGYNYTSSKYLYGTSSASLSNNQQTTIVNENIANYDLEINKDNRLNLMGGFTYQQYIGTSMGASGTDFLSDAPGAWGLPAAATFGNPSAGYTKWVLMSYLARANYSYKGRYMATVSFRADGSSRYSEGNKWGYFPAAALAWRISDEGFLRDVDWMSDLKLRLGYGETGSASIDPYSTLNMLSQGKTPLGSGVVTNYSPSSTLPSDLKWETTAQWNVGIDVAFFKSRLRVTADYYDKLTRDLLNSVSLPTSSGYTTTVQNVGKMRNRGFELLVEGDVFQTKNFNWTLSANLGLNRNKIEELYGGQDIYGGSVGLAYVEDFVTILREGESFGTFYVYHDTGFDENGNMTYEDKNADGIYDNNDKYIAGCAMPDFTYGLNSSMTFKDFEFSFFLYGSQGNDIYNVTETANYDMGMGLNLRQEVFDSHWSTNNTLEQNLAAQYPRPAANHNIKHSDRFIEDGSYLRLKNIMLGYNLPVKKWGVKNWLSTVKIYVSAQNLFTITGYSGIDPEVNSWGGDTNAGLDYLTYPNVKTWTIGAKVKF